MHTTTSRLGGCVAPYANARSSSLLDAIGARGPQPNPACATERCTLVSRESAPAQQGAPATAVRAETRRDPNLGLLIYVFFGKYARPANFGEFLRLLRVQNPKPRKGCRVSTCQDCVCANRVVVFVNCAKRSTLCSVLLCMDTPNTESQHSKRVDPRTNKHIIPLHNGPPPPSAMIA